MGLLMQPLPFGLSVAPQARSRSRSLHLPSTSPLRGYAQDERRDLIQDEGWGSLMPEL